MITAGSSSVSAHRVSATARLMVEASTLTLPPGPVRDRYRREHRAELSALPVNHQIRYAVGALSTAWALRLAITKEKDMTTTPLAQRKPLLCRLNLHHKWRVDRTPDGEQYSRCTKCGKDDPGSYNDGRMDYLPPGA